MATLKNWIGTGAIGLSVAVAVGVGGCAAKRELRRLFASCATDSDCESSLCYDSVCTQSCTTSASCGGGVCIEKKCKQTGTSCSDFNACTTGDKVASTGCVGTPVDCGPDNGCQQIVCDPKVGCGAKALNVGEQCGTSPLTLCGTGGLETGGCKCSVWQASAIGPYDQVAIQDGKPVSVAVGAVSLRALAVSGATLIQLGKAQKAPGQPWRSWVGASNLTAQLEGSLALPPADVTETSDELVAVAAQTGRWLAVGASGNQALLVSATDFVAAGTIPSLFRQRRIAPTGADALQPKGVAVDASGSFAVVGTAGKSALLVRGKMAADAEYADPQVQLFKTATASPLDTAQLAGVAAHPKGWLAAGSALVAGKAKFWLAYTENGFGGTIASSVIELAGTTGGGFTGILRGDQTWVAWGTATTTSAKTQCLVAGLDAALTVTWVILVAPAGKPDADVATAIAAAPMAGGEFLVAAAIGSNATPWVFRTDTKSVKAQAVGSATRLWTVVTYGKGIAIGGDQAERAFVQRVGIGGETGCPKP
ncbi:MAG: hypothetical protein EXR77_14225 [Myxococcales bacterium]|nr:hypothetical protein [Myxococcales bacterium]